MEAANKKINQLKILLAQGNKELIDNKQCNEQLQHELNDKIHEIDRLEKERNEMKKLHDETLQNIQDSEKKRIKV